MLPRRGFDHGAAGLEAALALGGFDDIERDAVLDGAAGVEELHLGGQGAAQAAADVVQPHQRRTADGAENVSLNVQRGGLNW